MRCVEDWCVSLLKHSLSGEESIEVFSSCSLFCSSVLSSFIFVFLLLPSRSAPLSDGRRLYCSNTFLGLRGFFTLHSLTHTHTHTSSMSLVTRHLSRHYSLDAHLRNDLYVSFHWLLSSLCFLLYWTCCSFSFEKLESFEQTWLMLHFQLNPSYLINIHNLYQHVCIRIYFSFTSNLTVAIFLIRQTVFKLKF